MPSCQRTKPYALSIDSLSVKKSEYDLSQVTEIFTDQDFQISGFRPELNFNRLKLMPTFSLLSVLLQFAQPKPSALLKICHGSVKLMPWTHGLMIRKYKKQTIRSDLPFQLQFLVLRSILGPRSSSDEYKQCQLSSMCRLTIRPLFER